MVSRRVRKIQLDLEGVRRSGADPLEIANDLSTVVVTLLAATIQAQLGNLSEEDLIRECRRRIFYLRRDVGGSF